MTISIFVLKGDPNGKTRSGAFLFLSGICYVCSKEPSHCDGSFEYPQHMFWLRDKNSCFFFCYTLLTKILYVLIIVRKVAHLFLF